jgi:hypothetical protein
MHSFALNPNIRKHLNRFLFKAPMGLFHRLQPMQPCNFFELILKHTQDEWCGKPFLCQPLR